MTDQSAGLNLIGTLALKIHDLQMDAAIGASGMSPTACACLISVAHQDTAQTISDIAAICGLSHPAAVRLVEKLEKSDYVCKVPAQSDRREVHVSLTTKGYEMRDTILRARRAAIEPVLSKISSTDRAVIQRAAGVILSEMAGSRLESEQICRLCDVVACGGDDCPVEQKALMLEATAAACEPYTGDNSR